MTVIHSNFFHVWGKDRWNHDLQNIKDLCDVSELLLRQLEKIIGMKLKSWVGSLDGSKIQRSGSYKFKFYICHITCMIETGPVWGDKNPPPMFGSSVYNPSSGPG